MDETASRVARPEPAQKDVKIAVASACLLGLLGQAQSPCGVVEFVHGSCSGRLGTRKRAVAAALPCDGIATRLFDLRTAEEEAGGRGSGRLRFDIALLALRLASAMRGLREVAWLASLGGDFGASTGATAALSAAAHAPVHAVVSRGRRPALAGAALSHVRAPTLLLLGGADTQVLALHRRAMTRMGCERTLAIVPHAGRMFAEPGTLQEVMRLAGDGSKCHRCDARSAA